MSSLPGRGGANPYVGLFYDALKPAGVQMYIEPTIDPGWGRDHFPNIDAVHFHWPEYVWQHASAQPSATGVFRFLRRHVPGMWRIGDVVDHLARKAPLQRLINLCAKLLAVMRFWAFLRAASRAKVKVVWTMHNVVSHENWRVVDRVGFNLLGRGADLIICHSEHAKIECMRRYRPRCPVVVMGHGNYDGVYPQPRPKSDVLAELGLDPELPVAGCLGHLRGYKGIDVALQAMKILDGQVQFICAGEPHDSFALSELRQLVAETPRAVLVAKPLTSQEFTDLCSACDVILLPYRNVTGSGALLAALTMGRGVVATDLMYFRELLEGFPEAGVLAPPGDPGNLAKAIRQFLNINPSMREAAARGLADRYSWERVVIPVESEFQRLRLERVHSPVRKRG